MPEQPPLAFIYDRHATTYARGMLDLRLDGCRNWAARQGWEVAGDWIDIGDQALTDGTRLQFNGLCAAIEQYASHRQVLCLVHTWDRLTRGDLAHYQRKVKAAGGYTATTFGESDQLRQAEREVIG